MANFIVIPEHRVLKGGVYAIGYPELQVDLFRTEEGKTQLVRASSGGSITHEYQPIPKGMSEPDIVRTLRGLYCAICNQEGVKPGLVRVRPINLMTNRFYPYISRKVVSGNAIGYNHYVPDFQEKIEEIEDGRNQITTIIRKLEEICQFVYPNSANFGVFGHEIRNLHLACCMEVDTQFQRVLTANNYDKPKLTTQDFVKTSDLLKLTDYSVKFQIYPAVGSFTPFSGWISNARPTQDLVWYDSYNKSKHNRLTNFPLSNLENLFSAISAVIALFVSQFGCFAFDEYKINDDVILRGCNDLKSKFTVNISDRHPEEYYFEFEDSGWQPIGCFSQKILDEQALHLSY